MTTVEAPTSVIGQRLLRKEDPALLTGEAKFTNDLNVPGALHLALVRSPYAHARITSIDIVGGGRPARRRRRVHRRPTSWRRGPRRCPAPGRSPMT